MKARYSPADMAHGGAIAAMIAKAHIIADPGIGYRLGACTGTGA